VFPPLLEERIGGECCACFCSVVWRFSADEACIFACSVDRMIFAWMFYVLLPHGDVVRFMRDGHYLDTYINGVVGGGVDIVECRQVRRYRGASVLGWSGTGLHSVAASHGEPTTTLVRKSASPPAIAYEAPSVRHSCMGQSVANRVCVVGCCWYGYSVCNVTKTCEKKTWKAN
jgi:hypothetical protein